MSNAGGGEADKEMHGIAKEELADCTAALDELRLDLTTLLLPRYAPYLSKPASQPASHRLTAVWRRPCFSRPRPRDAGNFDSW